MNRATLTSTSTNAVVTAIRGTNAPESLVPSTALMTVIA